MECVQSSPVKNWQNDMRWARPSVDDNTILPHSAPSTCSIFTSSCRRASSFPLAHATALPSALKVRSQSESAGLNQIHCNARRFLYHDFTNSFFENAECKIF